VSERAYRSQLCAVTKQELIGAADLLDQGSSVQLPSYNYAKSKLVSNGLMSDSSYWTYLVSSSFSGICVVSIIAGSDPKLCRV
jgi:hypothetical protein